MDDTTAVAGTAAAAGSKSRNSPLSDEDEIQINNGSNRSNDASNNSLDDYLLHNNNTGSSNGNGNGNNAPNSKNGSKKEKGFIVNRSNTLRHANHATNF
ncbi:unnamed protein product [[Candida] boidinii]|nr:unnamed protein product [[Candida] boidinii]